MNPVDTHARSSYYLFAKRRNHEKNTACLYHFALLFLSSTGGRQDRFQVVGNQIRCEERADESQERLCARRSSMGPRASIYSAGSFTGCAGRQSNGSYG